MFKKFAVGMAVLASLVLSGCASVPMGSPEKDAALKQFAAPAADKAGLYVFRNTFAGQALKKTLAIDGKVIGETANKVYFYAELTPGTHKISTESEFSDNDLELLAEGGKNYFVEQTIKMGVFVGGAKLTNVGEEAGKAAVLECKLADHQPNVK
jgi:protein involved in sex pheromone biosynthesis